MAENENLLAGVNLPDGVAFEYPVGLIRTEADGTKARLVMDAGDVAAKVRELGKGTRSDLLGNWAQIVSCLADLSADQVELHLDDITKKMKLGKKVCRGELLGAIADRSAAFTELERLARGEDPEVIGGDTDAVEADANEQIERLKRSQEIFAKVEPVARDPMDAFDKALSKMGVVGERRAATAVFLAVASAHGFKPVNLILKAQSSSGKSFTTKAALKLSGATVKNLSSLSARAIVYDEPGSYAHTTVFLEEGEALVRKGDEKNDVAEMLRLMLSEGQLRHATVERDPDTGRLTTRWIEQEGPTGLITTTTRGHLDSEVETRMLSIWLDESERQTRAVMSATAKVAAGSADVNVDFSLWDAFAEYIRLGPREVVVPFAPALAELMPSQAVRARRDLSSILALVKASAMVHRAGREVDGEGRLVAQLEDYETALSCVGDAIAEAHGLKLTENAETFLTGLRDKIVKPFCEASTHPDGTQGKTCWDDGQGRPCVLTMPPNAAHTMVSQCAMNSAGLLVEYEMDGRGKYAPFVHASERELVKVLGVAKTTLRRHKAHVLAEGLIEYDDAGGPRQGRGGSFKVTEYAWDTLAKIERVGLPTVDQIKAKMAGEGETDDIW